MTARVQALVRSEQELLAGVSHELRTPISRLQLTAELLGDHPVPERYLTGMKQDLVELDALISELLEVSRLQLGESPLVLAPVDRVAVCEVGRAGARPRPRLGGLSTGPGRRASGAPSRR